MLVGTRDEYIVTCSFQSKRCPPLVIYLKCPTNNTEVALSESHRNSHTLTQISKTDKAALLAIDFAFVVGPGREGI